MESRFCAGFGVVVRFFLPRRDAAALVLCGNKQGAEGLRTGIGEGDEFGFLRGLGWVGFLKRSGAGGEQCVSLSRYAVSTGK